MHNPKTVFWTSESNAMIALSGMYRGGVPIEQTRCLTIGGATSEAFFWNLLRIMHTTVAATILPLDKLTTVL